MKKATMWSVIFSALTPITFICMGFSVLRFLDLPEIIGTIIGYSSAALFFLSPLAALFLAIHSFFIKEKRIFSGLALVAWLLSLPIAVFASYRFIAAMSSRF